MTTPFDCWYYQKTTIVITDKKPCQYPFHFFSKVIIHFYFSPTRKTIALVNKSKTPYGFEIAGGNRVGIYISSVTKSMPAETHGIKVGWKLVLVRRSAQLTSFFLFPAQNLVKDCFGNTFNIFILIFFLVHRKLLKNKGDCTLSHLLSFALTYLVICRC